ncbi:MAG: multidrug ABC transporter [Firmicutes bacterium GWF2_51_9]|nr:MAG: multidrug ABC transporter [Firmicutes bacterium GWF2_51_9]HAM63207.1 ABC transporter ATP-binding protein [Erysipelotrichaceae bacterium]HAO61346.1 ABC transporter ATP-binding protein [Erysipelotrichaceae bacterium]
MKQAKFVWRFLYGNRLKTLGIILVVLLYVSMTLISPLLFSFLIDNVINLNPITNPFMIAISEALGGVLAIRGNLGIGAALLVLIQLLIGMFIYLRGRWNGQVSEFFAEKVRNAMYEHLQRLPYSYHVKAKTGDLIQRCTSDVDTCRRFLAGQISELVYAIAIATIAMTILFNIYAPLAWIAVVSLPIIFLFAYIFFRKMQSAFQKSDEAEGAMSADLQENLAGTRVVKAFNREEYELKKFDKKNGEFRDLTFRLIQLLGFYWGFSDFVCLLQILAVVIFGIFFARSGEITVGNFFVFISYEGMILWPIRNVGRILSDMGKMSVSISRLNEILDTPIEDMVSGTTPDVKGDIVFDHVYFKYDDGDKDVLKDVSFSVKQGQTLAILGPTGSGKSSLMHLLTRLYDYNAGSITLNNHELKEIQRHHLRKNVGIVLQEPFLFSKTIFENIRMANPKAKEPEVLRAAQIASVHDVIKEFELGYKTLVGEKGVTLSGGQKQRIAIARTIINNCPILIFDDSLSAVDTQTDASIRSALREVSRGVTTFLITHRIASAQNADKIVVLQDGEVTQIGTHETLSKEEGLYQRIVEIQNAMIEGGDDE